MTSKFGPVTEAYVWTWLPQATEPVVAGRLAREGNGLVFNYGQSYLARRDKIALYLPELPLQTGHLPLPAGLSMPSCLRDAAPDAWGRRVIINRKFGQRGEGIDVGQLDELTYLLESGSDRVGALDFQAAPNVYAPRQGQGASLAELLEAASRVEQGVPMSPDLERALYHGTSLGGARPKAMIIDGDKKLIAKFSSQNDTYDVVRGEYIAMRLAAACGLQVAPVRLERAAGKTVLLVERFDRRWTSAGWTRKAMVSALTLFGFDEMMARYASYQDLCDIIRARFVHHEQALRELFGRLVFNILCGNTDDHARNHAAFWDGTALHLTPAYDICPQARAGNAASQAMKIIGERNLSQLALCLDAAGQFQLGRDQAKAIIVAQLAVIRRDFDAICDAAALNPIDREILRRRQFFNPFAFEGLGEVDADLVALGTW